MAIQNAITFVTLRGTGCTSDTQLFTSCKVPELYEVLPIYGSGYFTESWVRPAISSNQWVSQ